MSPGPNFACVFKVSTEERLKRASIATALGVTMGIMLHASLALFGVTKVLLAYPSAMMILKAAASVYLLYLAYLSFRGAFQLIRANKFVATQSQAGNTADDSTISVRKFFMLGFINCVLNPKAFLYFVAVLPQGLSQQLSSAQAALTLVVLGTITFAWFCFVSEFFRIRVIQRRLAVFKLVLSSSTGLLFAVLATGFLRDLI